MPRRPKSPTSDDEVARLNSEIARLRTETARLRARIEELEADLARKAPRGAVRGSGRADTASDNRARVVDGAGELVRGLASFSVGALRATTNVVGGVVGMAYDRNQPSTADSIWDRAEQVPVEALTFFMEGVSRAFEIPVRAIERLYSGSTTSENSGQG